MYRKKRAVPAYDSDPLLLPEQVSPPRRSGLVPEVWAEPVAGVEEQEAAGEEVEVVVVEVVEQAAGKMRYRCRCLPEIRRLIKKKR